MLAVEAREEGSDDDALAYFADLYAAGRLPTEDDDLLDRVEHAERTV